MPKHTQPTLPAGPELVLPERVTIRLAELAGAAREGLLALAVGTGIGVLGELLDADAERLVGPKGRHNPTRAAVRHGTQPGRLTLGGRRVRVDRPRVRSADGTSEVSLPTWEAFAPTELLDQLTLERMLARLSTRRYPAGLEPVGAAVEQAATGTSKSAVSRRFVAATEHALADLLAADLSGLDLVALLVDGVHVAEHTCVVALGITIDGTKVRWAWSKAPPRTPPWCATCWPACGTAAWTRPGRSWSSSTAPRRCAARSPTCSTTRSPNAASSTSSVTDRLPDAVASTVAKRMRRAYHHTDALLAQAELEALARELDRSHPGAAASLREGLAETLTIGRLGVPPTLARTLRSTNSIESMIAICRDHAANVKRWRDGQMVLRWVAAGMDQARRQFRRVNGHLHLAALRTALDATITTVTPSKEDAA